MRKNLLVLLVAAVSCCTIFVSFVGAVEQGDRENDVAKKVRKVSSKEKMMPVPEVQLNRLAKGLLLTEEQKGLIRPMLQDEYARLKEMRYDENLSPKEIQVKVEALRTETVAKIQTVLTPAQIEKHNMISDEIRSNKQKRMKENRKDRLGTNADPPVQQIEK